jgi:hypothetical protein
MKNNGVQNNISYHFLDYSRFQIRSLKMAIELPLSKQQ